MRGLARLPVIDASRDRAGAVRARLECAYRLRESTYAMGLSEARSTRARPRAAAKSEISARNVRDGVAARIRN